MRPAVITLAAVLVLACENETGGLGGSTDGGGGQMDSGGGQMDSGLEDAGSLDEGVASAPQCSWGAGSSRRPLEVGRTSADGCNECSCVQLGAQEGVSLGCTLIGCQPLRCSAKSDCGPQGYCHFDPGCGELGYCMVGQSRCPNNPQAGPNAPSDEVFCGCDGVTYFGKSCFGRPWLRRGPCP